MRTKTQLTLKVVDLATDHPAVSAALAQAATVRPLDDHWRDKAAKVLLAEFPGAWVHRGGHHIALHVPGPMPLGCMESTPCLARIVESREAVMA